MTKKQTAEGNEGALLRLKKKQAIAHCIYKIRKEAQSIKNIAGREAKAKDCASSTCCIK